LLYNVIQRDLSFLGFWFCQLYSTKEDWSLLLFSYDYFTPWRRVQHDISGLSEKAGKEGDRLPSMAAS
ncbi:MAG: hypothetical protein ACM3XR_07820, partial [Bacillota bacterium]